jgi:hypothetical protein
MTELVIADRILQAMVRDRKRSENGDLAWARRAAYSPPNPPAGAPNITIQSLADGESTLRASQFKNADEPVKLNATQCQQLDLLNNIARL